MLMAERQLFSDAEKCYRRVMELTPDDVETNQRLATVLNSLGQTEQAVALWESARAANPDLVTFRIPLIEHYESMGRHDEALGHFDG